jgi:hypothetical protein
LKKKVPGVEKPYTVEGIGIERKTNLGQPAPQ